LKYAEHNQAKSLKTKSVIMQWEQSLKHIPIEGLNQIYLASNFK
jgi:hypothetical protein